MAKIISMNPQGNSEQCLLTRFYRRKVRQTFNNLLQKVQAKVNSGLLPKSLNPKLTIVTMGLPASPHLQVRRLVQGEGFLCVPSHRLPGVQFCSLFLGDIRGCKKKSRGISTPGGSVGRGILTHVMLVSMSWSVVSHIIGYVLKWSP